MPRQTEKRLKGQQQVRDQDTFDFSVPRDNIVHARPHDSFVAPAKEPSGMENVSGFLNSIGSIGQTYAKNKAVANKEQHDAGYLAAAGGQDAPKDSKASFLEGYELYSGEAKVGEYKVAMQKLLAESHGKSAQEFALERDKVADSFMRGRTNAFVEGFILKARDYEDEIDLKFNQILTGQYKEDITGKANQRFNLDITELMADESTDSTMVHGRVMQLREELIKMGMHDPKVASGLALDAIGAIAVDTGNPSLMNFAMLKDKDGVAMADTDLKADIYKYTQAAQGEAERRDVAARRAKRLAHEDKIDDFQKTLVQGLTSGDTKPAQSALLELGKSGDVTLMEYKAFTDTLTEFQQEAGWGQVVDDEVYDRLESRAYKGILTLDEVRFNQKNLTRERGTHLLTLQNSIKDRKRQDRKAGNPYHPEEKLLSRVIKRYTAVGPSGRTIVKGGPLFAEAIEQQYQIRLGAYYDENQTRPSVEEIIKMLKDTEDEIIAEYEWDRKTKSLKPKSADGPTKPTPSKLRGALGGKP